MSNIKPIILILGKIIGIFVMAKLSENKKNLKWKYNNVRKRALTPLNGLSWPMFHFTTVLTAPTSSYNGKFIERPK